MFGGFRKFIAERFLLNTIYRKNLRMWWLPTVFAYICKIFIIDGAIGMRIYDNAAYDYFYFI